MPISDLDLARARAASQTSAITVNVVPRVVVATARVNQTAFPSSFGEIAVRDVSAGWTNVQVGQMVLIGTTAGAYDVSVGVVRLAPTTGTLYIDGKSNGDTGFARRIATAIGFDQYVTVLDYFPMWTLLSRIFNRTFFKRYNVPYDGSGSSPYPVANAGSWQQGDADSSGYATFTLPRAGTPASFAWFGKTITSYAWTLPTGAVVVSGSVSSASVRVRLPAGFHSATLTVTDNEGKAHTATTLLWANGAAYPAFNDRYATVIEQDSQSLKGRDVTLRINGDVTRAELFPGTAFFVSERATFNGESLTAGTFVDGYAGYYAGEATDGSYEGRGFSVSLKSPYGMLNEMPMVNQAIIETPTPANWTQVKTGFGTTDFATWYVLYHHTPSMLRMFDYAPLGSAIRKRQYGLTGSRVSEFTDAVTGLVSSNIGSASDGGIYVNRDPMIESLAFRTSMDARIPQANPLTDADVIGQLEINYNHRYTTGQTTTYAFALTGNQPVPLGAIAPGIEQAQGVAREETQELLVRDITELQRIAGNRFQRDNSDVQTFTITLNRNFDLVDPAKHFTSWVYYAFSADVDPRGEGFSGRGIVENVERSWAQAGDGEYTKTIRWTIRPETFGQPGQILPSQRGEGENSVPETTIPAEPETYSDASTSIAFAWNDEGYLVRSKDWQNADPLYFDLSFDIGVVNDACVDYASARVATGGVDAELGVYAVTTDSNTLFVWYTADASNGEPLWELLATYLMSDDSVVTSARIQSSKSVTGLVAVAWKDLTGVYVARASDGASFGDAVQVGVTIADGVGDRRLGLAVEGSRVVVSAPNTDTPTYKLYIATGATGDFEILGGQTRIALQPHPMIIANGVTLYVTDPEGETRPPDFFTADGVPIASQWTLSAIPFGGDNGNGTAIATTALLAGVQPSRIAVLVISRTFASPTLVAGTSFQFASNKGAGSIAIASMVTTFTVYDPLNNIVYQATNNIPANNIIYAGTAGGASGAGKVEYKTTVVTAPSNWGAINTNVTAELGYISLFVGALPDEFPNPIFPMQPLGSGVRLYRVDTFTSDPTWTYITPPSGYIPYQNYGLAINPANANQIYALGTRDSVNRLLVSTDKGANWTTVRAATAHTGAIHTGARLVVFGDGVLDVSVNGGTTLTSKVGLWEATVGAPVHVVRGVLPVL